MNNPTSNSVFPIKPPVRMVGEGLLHTVGKGFHYGKIQQGSS